MSLLKRARTGLRRLMLGDTDLPQQCTIALPEPQDEITVWLHGAGEPRDVTDVHAPACAAPFTVGIGLADSPARGAHLSLRFCERHGERRLLGEIGLRASEIVRTNGPPLHLFEVRNCRNYCLPRARLWAHGLHQAYVQWRSGGDPDVRLSALDTRSMVAFFICPRPVVLVSVAHGEAGNMFPMNLMGSIGGGYMAFSLNRSREASPLVEQARRVAFSNVPSEYAETARRLGANHKRKAVEWNQLPFETIPSATLGIPVPRFALRVRELEIEAVRQLGSHTLFVARVIRDQRSGGGPQFVMIHGLYQAWRLRMNGPPRDAVAARSSHAI